jgi:hypothetical protein
MKPDITAGVAQPSTFTVRATRLRRSRRRSDFAPLLRRLVSALNGSVDVDTARDGDELGGVRVVRG